LRRSRGPEYPQANPGLVPLSSDGDAGLRHAAATLVILALTLGASAPLAAQSGFGFTGALGWESVSGGASQVLESGITGEFDVYYMFGHLRTGIGVNVVSYAVEPDGVPPVVQELTDGISRVTLNLLVGYKFITSGTFQPYVEGRIGYVRFRPEWDYWLTPPEPGENTSDRERGIQYTLRGGLEIPFARKWSADVSAVWSKFNITEVTPAADGLEPFDSGSTLGFLVGTSFYP
jgi:opacity protein-like surface antigen